MNQPVKRAAIREFFLAPRPSLHPRTLVVGGCVAVVGAFSFVAGDGAGVVLAALGALYALVLPVRTRPRRPDSPHEEQYVSAVAFPRARDRYRARPSSEEVTAWLLDDLARIRKESESRLGIDETTREPLCVVGPLYSDHVEGIDPGLVVRRRTTDGYLYSTYRISVFHFCDSHLAVYECNFNLLLDHMVSERTVELFYKDVVAVQMTTESSRQVLKSGVRLESSTTFSLTAASGDRIRVVIDDPAIAAGERLRSLGDAAVANIRAMLRQYKAPLRDG